MSAGSRQVARAIGALALGTGLLLTPWSLGREPGLSPTSDGQLFTVAVALDATAVVIGAILLRANPPCSRSTGWMLVPALAITFLAGLTLTARRLASADDSSRDENETRALEDALLGLSTELGWLRDDLLDLSMPGPRTRASLSPQLRGNEVKSLNPRPADSLLLSGEIRILEANLTAPGAVNDPQTWTAWQPLLERVDYFEHAAFRIIDGDWQEQPAGDLSSRLAFEALARTASGATLGIHAKIKATWTRDSNAGEDADWRLVGWHTTSMKAAETAETLFEEVSARALPDPETRRRALESLHDELVTRYVRDPTQRPRPGFTFASDHQHPGLAVVDFDGDGWDDLFIMPRWSRTQLLRNEGGGTFAEVATIGDLEQEGYTTSAIFADFDNDGDADAMLGRSLYQSIYIENEDGSFIDRTRERVTSRLDPALPGLVTSIAAADYDLDGLLDVYLSTNGGPHTQRDVELLDRAQVLPANQVAELQERAVGKNAWLDRVGPPNVLLHNNGLGHFERVLDDPVIDCWRNTFQSTWADYDDDGDPDLYVANDFSPNNLIRNEAGRSFEDVTDATGVADVGFGMGAAWGDYDRDGLDDLYVTNMYSKAGRRITERLGQQGEKYAPAARGNSLFHNDGSGFSRVSGLDPPALTVEKAGWGWGGQFIDADNDGFLDIHALSGHYSAPPGVAIEVDT